MDSAPAGLVAKPKHTPKTKPKAEPDKAKARFVPLRLVPASFAPARFASARIFMAFL